MTRDSGDARDGGDRGGSAHRLSTSLPKPTELTDSLRAYEQGHLSGGALCAAFRAACASWPGLPPRFAPVLETLLQPLESSALFSEESCAFSRHDLAASLRPWLDAAQQRAPLTSAVTATDIPHGHGAPGKDPAQ